jgi:pyruvate/2-oxoglutarate dehydrogenase complex dihydrolipoamide dehydrogenase (E3) component
MTKIPPLDSHNSELLALVRPPNWVNPKPEGRYNLVAVGGGTAGLVCAAGAAILGGRAALVERNLLGGDCLVTGCVPSKALIRGARAASDANRAAEWGVRAAPVEVDFAAVMRRVRELRAAIGHHDSAKRFSSLGVDVYFGDARFTGRDRVEVGGRTLRFSRGVIATGGRALIPPIPGLAETGYLTHETVFNLTERPDRLLIIGGGPIGIELAQSFARLGSRVIVVEMMPRLLGHEDPDAVGVLRASLERDGVEIRLATQVVRVDGTRVTLRSDSAETTVDADTILVGAGRAPNVAGLGLEKAGVEFTKEGVTVDDRLRTSNRKIYAAGDVALRFKFTHTAEAAARIVLQNALFPGRARLSKLTVPWCTYTSPEIAHVGMYEEDARERGIETDTFRVDFNDLDRAIIDGETQGFVKLHVKRGSDKIVGGTIVAEHAGEMIGEITLAIVAGIGLGTLSSVIHPYPTQAEAIRKAADEWKRAKLTPTVAGLLRRWLAWRR